jgi:hypothetical protein
VRRGVRRKQSEKAGCVAFPAKVSGQKRTHVRENQLIALTQMYGLCTSHTLIVCLTGQKDVLQWMGFPGRLLL